MREVKLIPVPGHAGTIAVTSDDVFGCNKYYLDPKTGILFLEFSSGSVLKLVAHGEAFKVYQWRPPEYAPIVLSESDEAYSVTGEFDWVRAWRSWLPTDEEVVAKLLIAFPHFNHKRFDGDMEELDQWYNRESVKHRKSKTAARQEAAR